MLGAAAVCFCFFSLADVIAALVVLRILLQFLMQHVGVIYLRRTQPELKRPFRIWLYPLPPLLAIAGFLYILVERPNFLREILGAGVVLVLGDRDLCSAGVGGAGRRWSGSWLHRVVCQSEMNPGTYLGSLRSGPGVCRSSAAGWIAGGSNMLIRNGRNLEGKIASSEITPQEKFFSRRNFVAGAAALGVGALALKQVPGLLHPAPSMRTRSWTTVPSKYTVPDAQTPFSKATTYNNFYEFGTDKSDPAKNAHTLHTRPWTVEFTGLIKQKKTADIDSIMKYRPIESRVYRHRCVEAWSMVIPWDGYSLSELIAWAEPLPSAKYVQFLSDDKNSDMPDKPGGFDWPYSEGLRMDEAMNPLCLLTFGCYGEALPNQNGAPIRVVSPWKYGFKNGKSIVKFNFTDKQPHTLWNDMASNEYGFYSNVNPNVDHPRWSQAHERRIDSSAFPKTIPTQMFNGYGDQVASLYAGMDLRKYF